MCVSNLMEAECLMDLSYCTMNTELMGIIPTVVKMINPWKRLQKRSPLSGEATLITYLYLEKDVTGSIMADELFLHVKTSLF